MIPCTDFIPAYSELFKALDRLGGRKAVEDFWTHLSKGFLENLRDLVTRHGIRGCWQYWSRTLNEEAADFTMELDEEAGEFKILMHHCPSKGLLMKTPHITPYPDYCRHCVFLYPPLLRKLGYETVTDLSRCDEAMCSFVVSGPAKPAAGKPAPKGGAKRQAKPPASARKKAPRAG